MFSPLSSALLPLLLLLSAPWHARGVRQVVESSGLSDDESAASTPTPKETEGSLGGHESAPATPEPKEATPEEQLEELMDQVRSAGEVSEELLVQMQRLWNQEDVQTDSYDDDMLKGIWQKTADAQARAWFARQQQGSETVGICAAKVAESTKARIRHEGGGAVKLLCARFDRGRQLDVSSVMDGVACLPAEEEFVPPEVYTYTPDWYRWEIVKKAAEGILVEAAIGSLCGRDEQLAKAPWDQACPKVISYSLLSARKQQKMREENCGADGVANYNIEHLIESFKEGSRQFVAGFATNGVCLAKFSAMILLSETDLHAQLSSLITQGYGIWCTVPKPDAKCKRAPDAQVEECGNALLKAYIPKQRQYLVQLFCENDASKDYAASSESGHMKFIGHVFGTHKGRGETNDLPYVCTQSDELLEKAALAAFQCGCPWKLKGGQPPVIEPLHGSIHGMSESEKLSARASRWKSLGHSEGLSKCGTTLVNSIATLAEERPKTLKGLLELAMYPDYANGPVAHLGWSGHHDTRFQPSGERSSFNPYASKSNPKTLRVFRFAMDRWEYNLRLKNTNVGDLAHVCGWGSTVTDKIREGKSDYALFIYTITTDGTRASYAKCNDKSCGSSTRFGWRFKDVGGKDFGCLKGDASWYSLPDDSSYGRNWEVKSLDRVISWKCARDLGLFKKNKQEFDMFSAIDKILFTLDGCHACPDVLEPDDTPQRVCPHAAA